MSGIINFPNYMGGGEMIVKTLDTGVTGLRGEGAETTIAIENKISSIVICSFAEAFSDNFYDTTSKLGANIEIKYSDGTISKDSVSSTSTAYSGNKIKYSSNNKIVEFDKTKTITSILFSIYLSGINHGGATGHGCIAIA